MKAVAETVEARAEERPVLVICENVSKVEQFEEKFAEKKSEVRIKYQKNP